MLFIKIGIPIKNTPEFIEKRLNNIIRSDIQKKSKIIRKHYNIDVKQFIGMLGITLKKYENYAHGGTISSGYSELSEKLDNIINKIQCCDARR